jgi:hypothetical protein
MDAVVEHLKNVEAHAPSTTEQLSSLNEMLRKRHQDDLQRLDAKLVRVFCSVNE